MRLKWYAVGLFSFIILLVINAFAPRIANDLWTRDVDMGLWLMAGILVTQLASLGIICRWEFGRFEHRALFGSAAVMAIIYSAWIGFRWCGPVDRADTIAFYFFVYSIPVLFAVLDSLLFENSKLVIGRAILRNTASASPAVNSDDSPSESPPVMDSRLSLLSLFGWITLVAIACVLLRESLQLRAISYRSIRAYYDFSFGFLATLAVYFWLLHVSLLWSVLHAKAMRGIVATVLFAVFGLEVIRRLQEWWTSASLHYLDWELAMIVSGFILSHVVVGSTIRWLGWELRSSSVEKNLPPTVS